MSFFANMVRALGFGPDANISDDPLYADTAADSSRSVASVDIPSEQAPAVELNPVEFDPQMQNAIFDKVVEVFNQSLPDFLSGAIDPEAQKKYLRDCLDQGVAQYLHSLNVAAAEYCENRWKARQNDMAAEIEAIRVRANEVEKQSSDIKQKQLSADRQKRALTERVHELESQQAKLISEREQLELENRSLLSRLKASTVMQDDFDKANAELTAARAELMKLRDNPSLISQEREDALKAEINRMSEGIESLKEQLRVGDEIRDELRRRLKDSEATVNQKEKEIEEINLLVKQFDDATARFDEINARLAACQEKISSQKKKLAARDEEIASLKATISENIKRQAEREKLLRKEIDDLRPPMVMSGKDIDFDVDGSEDEAPRISEEDLSEMEAAFETDGFDDRSSVEPVEDFASMSFEEFDEPAPVALVEESIAPVVEEVAPVASLEISSKPEEKAAPQPPKNKKSQDKSKPEQLSLF